MLAVKISELKNQLSAILRKVKRGEDVLVMDRNQPVARLSAVLSFAQDDDALLQDLVRRGVVEPPKKKMRSRRWFEKHLVRLRSGSAVEELLKEREEST